MYPHGVVCNVVQRGCGATVSLWIFMLLKLLAWERMNWKHWNIYCFNRSHGQTRTGTTMEVSHEEFNQKRYWDLVERKHHRLPRLCVCAWGRGGVLVCVITDLPGVWSRKSTTTQPKLWHHSPHASTQMLAPSQLPYKAFKQLLRVA